MARARAAALGDGSIFADQFDNLANTRAHEAGTAAEIWAQRSREDHTRLDWPVGRGWRDWAGCEEADSVGRDLAGPSPLQAQTRGTVDAFVMGAGTGGTLAGVSRTLKRRKAGP